MCNFSCIIKKGMNVHMRGKHVNIEQIDWNIKEKDSKTCEFCDINFSVKSLLNSILGGNMC